MQRKEFNRSMRQAIAAILKMSECVDDDCEEVPARQRGPEDAVETPEEPQEASRRRAGGVAPKRAPTRRRAPKRLKPVPVVWPELKGVEISFREQELTLSATSTDWILEKETGMRYATFRKSFAGMLLMVFLEQFEGFDATRVTWALCNGFANTGAVLFKEMSVKVDGVEKFGLSDEMNAIQVRGILARRCHIGPDAQKLFEYQHVAPIVGYPAWVDKVCSTGLVHAIDNAQQVGIYRIGDPGVKGKSSLNGSHGGWKIAPWHMGPEGWQRGSRNGYRWAEVDMFDTLDRSPLASFSPDSLRPHNPHSPYWPGRENVVLPGFKPDLGSGECAYLAELEEWEAHSYSHLHRETCAAAMLAPKDVFARWLLTDVYWHDNAMWLDGKESDVGLFMTAKQIIRDLPENVGWDNGGRGLAHVVRCYLYARPYFTEPAKLASGELWDDVLPDLLRHIARPNGLMHSFGPDTSHPNVLVACRAREVDLMYPNLTALELDKIADKVRATMAPIGGVHVAASFDPRFDTWQGGERDGDDYYPLYDLIRRDSLDLIDLAEPWPGTLEQLISMVPPDLARILG